MESFLLVLVIFSTPTTTTCTTQVKKLLLVPINQSPGRLGCACILHLFIWPTERVSNERIWQERANSSTHEWDCSVLLVTHQENYGRHALHAFVTHTLDESNEEN